MAATYNVYINPNTVTLGSATMFGVQSIAITQASLGQIVSSGDDDAYAQINRGGAKATTITVTTHDISDSHGWVAGSGTLGATFDDAIGGTEKTLAVVGCTVTNVSHTVNHNGVGVGVVTLLAESADSTTNPVSIS